MDEWEAALEGLAEIPGLDSGRGLLMVRGNARKYLSLLQLFVSTHSDDMARLEAALAAGQQSGVERLPHSLKGAADFIGAGSLAQRARELEAALRTRREQAQHSGEIEAKMDEVRFELSAIAAALARLPPLAAAASVGQGVPATSALHPDSGAEQAARADWSHGQD